MELRRKSIFTVLVRALSPSEETTPDRHVFQVFNALTLFIHTDNLLELWVFEVDF